MSVFKIKNAAGQWENVIALKGNDGVTPQITFKAVTLPPSSDATITTEGTKENPIITLGIPKGEVGDAPTNVVKSVNGKTPNNVGNVDITAVTQATQDGSGNVIVDTYATKTELANATAKPTNHASADTTFGVGTDSLYGHVRLSNSTTSSSGVSGGYAATPAAVKSAYDLANAALPKKGGDISGHVYLTGAAANSSTANTSQIVFGTSSNNHVAISSNTNALVINPDTSSTTNQIVLYLDKASLFPCGIEGNASSSTKLKNARTIAIDGAVTGTATSFDGTANISINTTAVDGSKVTGTVPAATKDGSGNVITSTYLTKADASNTYLGKTAKASSATNADSATKASQDGSGNVITSTYATKSDVNTELDKKANKSHTHAISDVTNLQTKLDEKANANSLAAIATSGAYSDLSGAPTSLKNPAALKILSYSSANLATYDGSAETTVTLSKANVGLSNVTNESKATMFTSPTFTGTPTAPTAAKGTSNKQIATTEFVATAVAGIVSGGEVAVDSAYKDGLGNNIAETYATKTELSTGLDKKADVQHISCKGNGAYYIPLGTMVVDGSSNYGNITIVGRIGGWEQSNSAYVEIMMLNRSSARDGNTITATVSSSGEVATALTKCDIVVYRQDDTSAVVYLKTTGYWLYDFDWSTFQHSVNYVAGSNVDALPPNASSSIPAGTLVWSLSNAPKTLLDKSGNLTATNFIGNASSATKAIQDGSGNVITSTYLTKTDASNTYLGKTAKAASATSADSATKATQDGSGNVITSTYATKTDLDGKLNISGGKMTGELQFDGGDASGSSKIVLVTGKGQITSSDTSTLFGYLTNDQIAVGSTSWNTVIRGKATRPTYNGNELALKSDVGDVSLSALGITATAAELNYVDGVTSNIQTQLNGKLSTSGTAAKATADASGNTITSTYATKTELTNGLKGKSDTDHTHSTFNRAVTIEGMLTVKGAVEITGTLDATAAKATKATQDGSGNVITSTYATKSEMAGYLPLTGGTVNGDLTISNGNTLTCQSLEATTITASGDIKGATIQATSDIRLKSDLVKIEQPFEKIEKLNAYSYYLNGHNDKRRVGVIAQEVEQVLPEAVSEDQQGYKSVDYAALTALCIETNKALLEKIRQLEQRIDELTR